MLQPDTYQHLVIDLDNGIATVRMNRPERLNAFNKQLAMELVRVTEEIREDPAVRVAVLTGTGRGFCSGVDIKAEPELGRDPRENPFRRDPLDEWGYTSRLPLAWWEIDKPTIAAINGVAAGGGFAMSLTLDIRIAAESARIYPMFIQRGTSPEVGSSWTVPHHIGLSRAYEWMYTGEPLSGAEAATIGLVSRAVPDDQLMPEALKLARKIADGPPIGLRLTRRAIQHSISSSFRDHLPYETRMLGISSASEDANEGRKAVEEKRRPVFRGR